MNPQLMGERIKECRKKMQLTGEKLGKLLSKTKYSVYLWETGKIKNIHHQTLEKMSEIFEVSTAYLLGLTDEKNGHVTELPFRGLTDDPIPVFLLSDLPSPDQQTVAEFQLTDLLKKNYRKGKVYLTEPTRYEISKPTDLFAIQLTDDAMEPTLQKQDVLIIDPNRSPLPGEFVVASVNNHAILREYQEREQEQFLLAALNPRWVSHTGSRKETPILGTAIELKRSVIK